MAGRPTPAVAAGIRERGDTPFPATVAGDTAALRVYARLGFVSRAEVTFAVLRTPPDRSPGHALIDISAGPHARRSPGGGAGRTAGGQVRRLGWAAPGPRPGVTT